MHKIYLLILTFVLGFTVVNAQPLVRVTGKILDPKGDVLQQVTVSVLVQKESTITDFNGYYTIYSKTT